MSAGSGRYFHGMEALRAGAALSVLVFHTIFASGWAEFPKAFPLGWFRGGWVGLDLFFVISGLVVGQSALSGYEREGRGFWREFAWRRIRRIMPLYVVSGALYLVLVHPEFFAREDLVWQFATHLGFVHNLWADTAMSINPPSWSLGNEVQLYVLLALLTPLLVRSRGVWVAIVGLLLAFCYRASLVHWSNELGLGEPAALQHAVYQLPGMLDSFALGVALALGNASGSLRLGRAWGWLLVLAGLAGLSIGAVVVDAAIDGSIWQNLPLAAGLRSLTALAAAAVVLGAMQFAPSSSQRPVSWMRHAGDLSYGIYLWHAMVLELLLAHTSYRGIGLLAAVLFTTLLLAESSWRCVERPALRWGRSKAPANNRANPDEIRAAQPIPQSAHGQDRPD